MLEDIGIPHLKIIRLEKTDHLAQQSSTFAVWWTGLTGGGEEDL